MCIDNHCYCGVPDGTARTCSDSDRRGCDSDAAANGDSARIQHTHCRPVGLTVAVTLSFSVTTANGLTHADTDIDTGRHIHANPATSYFGCA